MTIHVGVRREDKSVWERRVPVTPDDAELLWLEHGVQVIVQPSATRVFTSQEFESAGAIVHEDLSSCRVVLGIKEMPEESFRQGGTYVFFAHVIKGQKYNMPMLQRIMDLGCTLIDYERVVDEQNRRLIFFGWHAGVAGAIDTLWALGRRLAWEGISNPFSLLQLTHDYHDLAEAKAMLAEVGRRIEEDGLPEQVTPLIVGVAGYGNVSRGVQEILNLLPTEQIEPEQIASVAADRASSRNHIYMAVFKEWHMVEPLTPGAPFDLQDYYARPERYRGVFGKYLPHLTVLANAIFWTGDYPRLVTNADLSNLFRGHSKPRLLVIGDISCDIEGAIECTVKSTSPGDPVFVYDPASAGIADGYEGPGVVIMAVDILPAELPREASTYFSRVLRPFIPAIAACDFSVPFSECSLPPEIRRATIVYRGQLTPDYEHIRQHLGK
ncbi:MAG TPA: bifunctional lysine ketoglutarate reductase /saccharopine dehydrogenase family protein [Anaerolineae bacterium]|nr:bifunctional lysine ketoglutarate reductase /saccharopine dehydrogenase family protein [Anaerolineae bacterium]